MSVKGPVLDFCFKLSVVQALVVRHSTDVIMGKKSPFLMAQMSFFDLAVTSCTLMIYKRLWLELQILAWIERFFAFISHEYN